MFLLLHKADKRPHFLYLFHLGREILPDLVEYARNAARRLFLLFLINSRHLLVTFKLDEIFQERCKSLMPNKACWLFRTHTVLLEPLNWPNFWEIIFLWLPLWLHVLHHMIIIADLSQRTTLNLVLVLTRVWTVIGTIWLRKNYVCQLFMLIIL